MTKAVDPKKSLGQHFLADTNLCHKIARFADIKPDDTVIEIGPGTGNLNRALLDFARYVIVIEIDDEMIRLLRSRFSEEIERSRSLHIIHADILGVNWDRLITSFQQKTENQFSFHSVTPTKLVGNLPYNIATRILSNMTESMFRFQSAVFMVQREVARRISALPGKKDYGYFSLLMQYHFRVQRGFDVRPGSFVPKPQVNSHVFKLTPNKKPQEIDYNRFLRIISCAFRQRRKTLWNNLKSEVSDEESLKKGLKYCGVDRRSRPEQVHLRQYLCMTRVLSFPA